LIRLFFLRTLQPLAARFPGAFYRIASGVGWLAFHLNRPVRRSMVSNMLPLVDGDLARAEKEALQSCRHVVQYYVDLSTIPRRNMATFESQNLTLVNGERLGALEHAGPVIAVSAHTGNGEFAIQALTYRGRPFVALVEAQRPKSYARALLKLRSAAGGTFHEANFRGIRACLETLQSGGLVGFMGDRDIQDTGICVPLFGRQTKLPTGPWELARRTGALVLPVFSARISGDRFRVFVEEPFHVARTNDEAADVRVAVERFAGLLEEHLQRDPGQWAVTEDFWKAHRCG